MPPTCGWVQGVGEAITLSSHVRVEGAVDAGPREAALVDGEALLKHERRPRHEEAVDTCRGEWVGHWIAPCMAAIYTHTLSFSPPPRPPDSAPLTLLHQSVAAVAYAQHWHLVVHARGLDLGGTAAHIADIAPQPRSICMQEVVDLPDCVGNAAGCGVSIDGNPTYIIHSIRRCAIIQRLDSLHWDVWLRGQAGISQHS